MAIPTIPGLIFNVVTSAGATSIPTWLALLVTTGAVTTFDDGVSIPTTSRWVFTAADSNKMVLAVPAATSPIAGKVVLIWAYESGVAPGALALLSPCTSTATNLYFGSYMANAGATVSAADITATWSTNTANGPCNGTNGTFSGWNKVYAGTTPNNVLLFLSDDYIIVQLDEAGSLYWSWGGMGIRAPSDSTTVSESGLGGRVFDHGVSGSSTAVVAAMVTATSNSGGTPCQYANTHNGSHWYYRIPGQNTSSSTNTMRPVGSRTENQAGIGLILSAANDFISADGSVEGDAMGLRDLGVAGRSGMRVGRSRAFFYGPRAKSASILSSGGTKKWIACGASRAASNDAFLLPYV